LALTQHYPLIPRYTYGSPAACSGRNILMCRANHSDSRADPWSDFFEDRQSLNDAARLLTKL